MRKKIVAGNWKMNLDLEQAGDLTNEVCRLIKENETTTGGMAPEVIFFPPFVFLPMVEARCRELPGVYSGAQNCHHMEKGAFTGEVSAAMIRSLGVTHTLVGHSERRAYFGEDEPLLAQKVKLALENDLTPVFCCGEVLKEREAGRHFEVIASQLVDGLFWLDKTGIGRVVIAYEPVWAIGTGVTASPEQAQEVHAHIRKLLAETYGQEVAGAMTILYGGSCNARNAKELFSKPDVDGGLIGGASLKPADFFQIIQSF
ncbi:MAG: triose-phosphate isomerase [Bacteroidales bacterium]